MNFSSSVLSIDIHQHVATLWLDKPEKRNAMSKDIVAELPLTMTALANNEQVRAVVIAAKGESFSVGLDLMAATTDNAKNNSDASRARTTI